MRERNIPDKYKNKKIYSISRLNTYKQCPYNYYLTYIKKLKGKQNVYSFLGGQVHDLIEKLQKKEIDKNDAYRKFRECLFECEILDIDFPSEKVRENFEQSIIHYFENYEPINAKRITLEKEFYTEIEGYVLMGFIDALIQNHNNTLEIIDYKTSSKYKKKDLDKYGLQLVLYAYAIEKEYGIKINKLKWDMLKYAWCEYDGKRKFVQRNKWVKEMSNEIKKDLQKLDIEDYEIDIMLERAIKRNDISNLPDVIKNKYKLTKGYIEYPYNEGTKQMLIDYVIKIIKEIESKNENNEEDWQPLDINKDSFFCGTLCGQSHNCKYWRQYVEENIDKFETKEKNDLNSLFE